MWEYCLNLRTDKHIFVVTLISHVVSRALNTPSLLKPVSSDAIIQGCILGELGYLVPGADSHIDMAYVYVPAFWGAFFFFANFGRAIDVVFIADEGTQFTYIVCILSKLS